MYSIDFPEWHYIACSALQLHASFDITGCRYATSGEFSEIPSWCFCATRWLELISSGSSTDIYRATECNCLFYFYCNLVVLPPLDLRLDCGQPLRISRDPAAHGWLDQFTTHCLQWFKCSFTFSSSLLHLPRIILSRSDVNLHTLDSWNLSASLYCMSLCAFL